MELTRHLLRTYRTRRLMLRFWDRLVTLYLQAIGYTKTQEARHMPNEKKETPEEAPKGAILLKKLGRKRLIEWAKEFGLELEDEK